MIVFFLIFLAGKAGKKNKNLKMKVVDDKLKIIDDVPTSAVEMAVKEKVCIIFQKNNIKYFRKNILKFLPFLVSEKSPKTRTMCGRDQNCAQTFLQPKTY